MRVYYEPLSWRLAEADLAVQTRLQSVTSTAMYVKVTEDIPNGVLGWEPEV